MGLRYALRPVNAIPLTNTSWQHRNAINTGSILIVKPDMSSPQFVAYCVLSNDIATVSVILDGVTK